MQYISIKFFKRYTLNIIVILLYLLVTLIFTFPLFLHISTSTPLGDGSGDQFQSMWMFLQFKTALFELKTNPLWTDFMYYPQGTSLIYHMPIFLSLLALPFQYLLGSPNNLIVAYNVILMLTFVISGFGVYLLIRHLAKDPTVAFICGLLFAFCPYRLWHLNHINLLSTEWIPFYILYLIKSMEERSLKNFLWTGLFFVLTFLSSLTYAFFLGLFTLTYVLYNLIKSRDRLLDRRVIRNGLIALFAVILILSPILYGLSSTKIDWQPSMNASATHSANLLGYILPVEERSLLGGPFLPSVVDYHGISGRELFLGYVLLFFTIYTWIRLPRKKIKFWFFTSLLFMLVSLGPCLHVYDHSYCSKWLPYNLLYNHLPVLRLARTPSRFSVMVTFCLVVFSGYGLTRFFRPSKTQHKTLSDLRNFFRGFLLKKGMPLAVVMLVCLEFIVFPTRSIRVEIPTLYENIRNAQGEFAILEAPAFCSGSSLMCNVFTFYQIFHAKKLVNGYLTRPSVHSQDFICEIFPEDRLATTKNGHINIGTDRLKENNVKYILIHEFHYSWKVMIIDNSCLIIKEDPSKIRVVTLF